MSPIDAEQTFYFNTMDVLEAADWRKSRGLIPPWLQCWIDEFDWMREDDPDDTLVEAFAYDEEWGEDTLVDLDETLPGLPPFFDEWYASESQRRIARDIDDAITLLELAERQAA